MKRKKFRLPASIFNLHVHARDMNQAHKTTILQTLRQAIKAGIKIIGLMPNTDPAITSIVVLERYSKLIETALKKLNSRIIVGVWFGVTDDNLSECKKALPLWKIIGLKIYPLSSSGKTVTTGTIGVAKVKTIVEALALAKKNGKPVAVHCDHPKIIKSEGYTIRAETEYVKLIIRAMRKVPGARVLICHVSCRKSAELILAAQKSGLDITLELCPQYLWFDNEETNWTPGLNSNFYKCFNSLRSPADREFLISLLKTDNDRIILSSDHAPHTGKEKMAGAGGIPSLLETIPVLLTLAIENNISEDQVARLIYSNPARLIRAPIQNISNISNAIKLKHEKDHCCYNRGKVVNPWQGSRLYFPVWEK